MFSRVASDLLLIWRLLCCCVKEESSLGPEGGFIDPFWPMNKDEDLRDPLDVSHVGGISSALWDP
jgi:hypothetical protein